MGTVYSSYRITPNPATGDMLCWIIPGLVLAKDGAGKMLKVQARGRIDPEAKSMERGNMRTAGQHPIQNVADIPPLSHKEAGMMARVEVERFIDLLETLSVDDWSKPTYCTEWNVHQMVSHQAGSYAGFANGTEFKRQWVPLPQPKPGQMAIDAVNDLQVTDRTEVAPADLIAELRQVGPKAIVTRQRIPAAIRGLRLDFQLFLYAWRPPDILRALRWPRTGRWS